MVARNDDNREASPGADQNAAPAGLSWGRRQPISQDVSAGRRGQVKGLFGGDPSGSPLPSPPTLVSPEAVETRAVSLPAGEPDPMDSFFGAEQSMEASTLLENADVVKTGARRAAARAWPLPGPSVGESHQPTAHDRSAEARPRPASIRPEAARPRSVPPVSAGGGGPVSAFPPQAPPAPGERDTARPSRPGRSGMRHKRIEPDGLAGPDELPAAGEAPRRVEAPVAPRSQRPADIAAAQLMAADREPPVHSPRWVLTGSILLAALLVGGAFMFWSLRSTESPPTPTAPSGEARSRSAPSGSAPSGAVPPGSADDVVTWSPQLEHSHAPQVPAAREVPSVAAPAEEPAVAAPPPSLEPALAPAVPAQAAQPPSEPPAAEEAPSSEATAPAQNEKAAQAARVSSWLAAARRKLASDDAEGAEEAARKALAAEPQNLPAIEVLVRALVDQGRGADALPFARKLVQRAGKRVPFRLLLGDVLLMTGDEAAAKSEWQRALELAPEDAEIQRRLGL
jgi:hypothetical protein